MDDTSKSAVLPLSGGMDSATVLAMAHNLGFRVHALSFDYGQRNRAELECAAKVAMAQDAASHVIVKVDLSAFGGSALTGDIPVPKGAGQPVGIPSTYVPARNTVFLSLALAYAETLGTGDIFIGVNALDYSGYPDCRPEYIRAYETMANLAVKQAVEGDIRITIHTPLINMTKAQIVGQGMELGVDYSITLSCYDPDPEGRHCGRCAACGLRAKGFSEAGVADAAPRMAYNE
ncbi:MAG: 7-cyano-7-deazaguanine synthase QueC [Nitrospinota bacterium]|nr:7-cyano-7-deazaguanine synthase QueC [Nitrospinota bacterium]